jgi:IS30 family transposase
VVAAKLAEDWSPEQIAGWLKVEVPSDQTRSSTRSGDCR